MTAKEILDFLRGISLTPEKVNEQSSLAKDLNLIEQELPNELQNIYDQLEKGEWTAGLGNVFHCSAEIRARK